MKKKSTQQEILLMTGTSFTSRQWAEKDESNGYKNLSGREQLQNACWNGMLKEMLPEVYPQAGEGNNLYLWRVTEGKSFINLELGEYPDENDDARSVNPYAFYPHLLLS